MSELTVGRVEFAGRRNCIGGPEAIEKRARIIRTREDVARCVDLVSECLNDRVTLGATQHGTEEWPMGDWGRRLVEEPGYLTKRTWHMYDHFREMVSGNCGEDDEYGNLGGILFGCMVRLAALKANLKAESTQKPRAKMDYGRTEAERLAGVD